MDTFFWGGGGHYEVGLLGGEGVSFLNIIGRFKVKIQNGNIFWAANIQIFFFLGGGGG